MRKLFVVLFCFKHSFTTVDPVSIGTRMMFAMVQYGEISAQNEISILDMFYFFLALLSNSFRLLIAARHKTGSKINFKFTQNIANWQAKQ